MIPRPPRSTRTDTLFPYTTLFRSVSWAEISAWVINLSINGPNPTKDIDFLKGLIVKYQQSDENKKKQSASNAIAFITDQLDTISNSLQKVEMQLERFKGEDRKSTRLNSSH